MPIQFKTKPNHNPVRGPIAYWPTTLFLPISYPDGIKKTTKTDKLFIHSKSAVFEENQIQNQIRFSSK